MENTKGSRFAGFKIVMDVYPTAWAANVIRVDSPDDLVISNVWVDGPYTAPANRCGRRVAIYGLAGNGGMEVSHCCFSGGGMAFWLGVEGASCTIDVDHVTITDYATTRIDDNNGFFDQRTSPYTTPVHLHNSIFNSITIGVNAGTPTNAYGYNYHVESNIFYNVDTWVNHNVWASNDNVSLRPHYVTMADGRGYVTTNTQKGWFYSTGATGAPPVMTYPVDGSDIVGNAGTAIVFTVTATDPDTPESNLTYWAQGLPPGALFNPTNRQFSWSSPIVGVYPGATFYVSDGQSADSSAVTIYVLGAPTITYYVRTNGVDSASRDGKSEGQAWKTITYSLARATGGNKYEHNVIDVGPGTYANERSGWHGKTTNWHINIEAVESIDIVGAGPDQTHLVQGAGTIWEVDSIIRFYGSSYVGLRGLSVLVDNPTCGFINACIRVDSSKGIVLEDLWLTGTKNIGTYITDGGATTSEFRNGSGIGVFGNIGPGGLTVYRTLVDGFGRAFYTEALGGYHSTNLIRYCTFVEQDGTFDIDDGVALWSRANVSSYDENHIYIEKTIFAYLPANGTNYGLGMRVDSIDNLDDDMRPILFSNGNLFWRSGADGSNWYQPDLQLEEAATNDVSFNPQFYTNVFGLPFCANIDYGWRPIPEAGTAVVVCILAAVWRRLGLGKM